MALSACVRIHIWGAGEVSALLPQPGGFEGFGDTSVHANADDRVTGDVVEDRVAELHLDPTSFASSALHAEDENPAAKVTHFGDLIAPTLPSRRPAADDRTQILTPSADAEVGAGVAGVDQHLRVEVAQRTIDVPGMEGVVHATHNLHVLLRHRPRDTSLLPQPRCFQGFLWGEVGLPPHH